MDHRITRLAAAQHGVVSRRQLLDLGLTSEMVEGRLRSGGLDRVHRGVYVLGGLVGPLRPPRAREMAAVLACGADAWVSHGSAAALWEITRREDADRPVHVTLVGRDCARAGISAHRVKVLAAAERTVLDGIPVTTPARTILDLAGRLRPRSLEQAIARAERLELTDSGELRRLLKHAGPRPGVPVLRSLVGDAADGGSHLALTRSVAEEHLLALIRQGQLSPPEVNERIGGYEVDFLWRSLGVAVEVDGFAYHSSRRRFERDRQRDFELAGRGLQVVRVTWRQLTDEPHAVLVRLTRTLALAGARRRLGAGRRDQESATSGT